MDKKFRNIIIIISGVVLLISIGYSNGGRASVTIMENFASKVIIPIQSAMTSFSDKTAEKINDVGEIWENKRRITELENENAVLKKKIIDLNLKKYHLEELKKLENNLNYVKKNEFEEFVTASVVSKDLGNWFDMFTIDAGLNQGLKKYSVVISSKGLVGKVYEVGNDYSKVISIIDNKSNISFETLSIKNKYQGFINAAENGLLKGNLFDPNAELNIGMDIITTGQGIYPRGISIGKIIEINDDDDEFLKKIVIKPSVDFRNLQTVSIITINSKKREWIDEN